MPLSLPRAAPSGLRQSVGYSVLPSTRRYALVGAGRSLSLVVEGLLKSSPLAILARGVVAARSQ